MHTLRIVSTLMMGLVMSPVHAQTYFLNGNAAALGGDCYAVTPNLSWQSGTVWYADMLNLTDPFSLEFEMNFGNADDNGADGMVFVLQTVGPGAIGAGGGGMGYEGFDPSFGIEFDTFMNSPPNAGNNNDPPADHIAFLRDGNVSHTSPNNLAGPVQANAGSANIEDGQVHHVRIAWDPSAQTVSCWFDCVLRLSAEVDLISSVFAGNPLVTWGFTGSTGGLFNNQTVCLSDFILGTGTPDPICPGESVQVAAAGPPDATFSWSPSAGLSDPSIQNPVASPLQSTTYTVTSVNICGESFEEQITVEVAPLPEITPLPDINLCPGNTGTFTVEVNPPGVTYFWDTPDGSFASTPSGPTATVASPGTYTVAVTSSDGCTSQATAIALPVIFPDVFQPEASYIICPGESLTLDAGGVGFTTTWLPSGQTGSTLTINGAGSYAVSYTYLGCESVFPFTVDIPDLNANDLGPDQVICEGESVILQAGAQVQWNTGASGSSIAVSSPGTYSYELVSGNCSLSDSMELTVDPLPVFDLGPSQTLCPGSSINLTIPFPGQWSTGAVGPSITISEPGTVGVSVAEGVCLATDAVLITSLSAPVADLGDDRTYCAGKEIMLHAEHPANATFLWSTGATEPAISVVESGSYSVEVSNVCGTAMDSVEVMMEDCDVMVYVPNAFSPDGDGLNEAWKPVPLNVDAYEVWVYDRWGMEVFYTADIHEYWMGNIGGGAHYAPDGVYVFRIIYPRSRSEKTEIRGTVTIVR